MHTTISVHQARSEEIEWIKSCYDAVGFVHSDINCETIAVAKINGQRAALERLVQVTSMDAELVVCLFSKSFAVWD